jgi:hypothetical protein
MVIPTCVPLSFLVLPPSLPPPTGYARTNPGRRGYDVDWTGLMATRGRGRRPALLPTPQPRKKISGARLIFQLSDAPLFCSPRFRFRQIATIPGCCCSTFSRVLEQNLPLFAAAVFLAFGGLTGAVFLGGQAASLQVELLLCDSEVQLSSPCSVKVKQVGGLAAVRRKRADKIFFFGHFLKGNDF